MAEMHEALSLLVYGPSKAGKSTLAVTCPFPRVLLDVEGGARFLPITARVWDPLMEEPPEYDGTWDTAVVVTRNYETMTQVYKWLQSGKHPFKSVIIDSVSELQVKLIEQIAGREQMQMQAWGNLLRQFTGLMRDLRDLTMHPTNPLSAVVLVAMEREDKDGQKRPYLQGQSGVTLPYLTDITGYLNVETFQHADPTMGSYKVRRLHITPDTKYVAGERVAGRLGGTVEEADLDIQKMIDKVYATTSTTTAS